ncbi:cation:proton antiporter [Vagococcus entomophilus]|uniref:Cation/H+ exchanger transmembrane domain-containing protein n=1 Tax=Vagococcus entomophilus TaxID=1160095 RepID=A0A430AET6_9ENTE|nr:cation:proton antiporter [Vagococcus entomophilus]RSU05960.1 hypothetical protein CBF30_11660 [Vagococcus entomophilus]
MESFIIMTLIILIGTKFSEWVCQKLALPTVIGALVMGVILGPAVLSWLKPDTMIDAVAKIGVLLLMFIAGLESDLTLLKKYFRPAVTVAFFGVLFPIVFFFFLGEWLNLSFQAVLFLGLIFSATSVSISVQVLREYKKLDSEEGAITLGAAVVDDILVIILLSLFTSFVSSKESAVSLVSICLLVLPKLAFFGLLYVFGKYLLPFVDKWIQKRKNFQSVAALGFCLCLISGVLAEFVGMSDVLGAFFMGLCFARTSMVKEVDHHMQAIGSLFFMPFFFVSIGLSVQFDVVKNNFWLIGVVAILAILSKQLGGYLGAKIWKVKHQVAMVVGAGMVSRGEMALILVQIGYKHKLITSTMYSVCIVAAIVTTLVSPFLMKKMISKQKN